jgi:hypothetical protein
MIVPRKVFTSKTGTGASEIFVGQWYPNVSAVLNLAYGGTPTITVNLEGSLDGVSYVVLATGTFTSGQFQKLEKPAIGFYLCYRLNVTANTNVTVTDAYIGAGGC